MALSLDLGIPVSELGERLTFREMSLYREYHSKYGIGALGDYLRSGTEVAIIASLIRSAVGSTSDQITPAQIYSQLAKESDTSDVEAPIEGQFANWNLLPATKQQQLIESGLCNSQGVYNAPNII